MLTSQEIWPSLLLSSEKPQMMRYLRAAEAAVLFFCYDKAESVAGSGESD